MAILKAVWYPAWYELDQPIEVGVTEEFWFIIDPRPELKRDADLVFHNGLHSESHKTVRVTVTSIRNASLGDIRKIDTRGLDYTITLLDGTVFPLEAEENPGDVYGFTLKVTDWAMIVTLEVP